MHYLLSFIVVSSSALFGMNRIDTPLTQFQSGSFMQQVKQEKDKEQKEIVQIKNEYEKARKKDQYIQSITGISDNRHVVQWFEHDILPDIAQLPLVDARMQLQKVPTDAWYAHLKSKNNYDCPSILLIASPHDIVKQEIIPYLFDGNIQGTNALHAYAQQYGIAKALEGYAIVMQGKGIKPLSLMDSFSLYYTSPETYKLCKRLMPEFCKQKKDFRLSESERSKDFYFQDIKISKEEQILLKQYVPTLLKQCIQENYVLPQRPMFARVWDAVLQLGVYGTIPLVFTWRNDYERNVFLCLGSIIVGCAYYLNNLEKKRFYTDSRNISLHPLNFLERLRNVAYITSRPESIKDIIEK